MKRSELIWAVFLIILEIFLSREVIICVGDSITYGTGSSDRAISSYPVRLLDLVGEIRNETHHYFNASVLNYGVRSTTIQKDIDSAYWKTAEFHEIVSKHVSSTESKTFIILFGANDAKLVYGWSTSRFINDYKAFISLLSRSKGRVSIYICVPTVLLPFYASIKMNSTIVNGIYPLLIPNIANDCGVGVIDLFSALGGSGITVGANCIPFFVKDGLHPNDKGYMTIARTVAKVIGIL
jgi:sialate O-acetylesterase